MKMKPGTLAAQGGLAAAVALMLSACVTTGECTPAPIAEQTPAAESSAGAAAPATPAPASAYSVPAAGGTPQASPAVPPPDYNAPPPAEALSATVAPAPADVSVPDTELVAHVRSALATHNTTRGQRVSVSAHDGVVKLTGSVPSSVNVDQIVSVVTEVQGVREVNNLLKVGGK